MSGIPDPQSLAALADAFDPMTATALEVLGLRALPSDPRELDALVAPRDPTQWTWEKTHAWRHLRALLNTAGVEARTPEKQARP